MYSKLRFVFSAIPGMLAMWLLSTASGPLLIRESLLAAMEQAPPFQYVTPCATLLLDAAYQANVPGDSYDIVADSEAGCSVVFYHGSYEDSPKRTWLKLSVANDQCALTPAWPSADSSMTIFHGYEALIYRAELIYNGENDAEDTGILWCMPKEGMTYRLEVESDSHNVADYGSAAEPLPIAEVLWSLAEDRLPLSSESGSNAQPPSQPEWPGTSPEPPASSGQNGGLGIPPLVVVGSIAIPLAGAILGSAVATIIGLLGRASISTAQAGTSEAAKSVSAIHPAGQTNEQGLYWSERPWDEAGPGYVTKEEYERTKDMLAQGYKWTNGGWQTPDEIQQSGQWQQNNREAVAREDEQFLQELRQDRQREFPQQDLRTFEMRFGDFREDLYTLRDELEKTNYVLNPWQGDPTILIHKGITIKNMAYDATLGKYTGKLGLTCGDYVEKTSTTVNAFLQKHLPGATVESVIFDERSSRANASGLMNWLDSRIDDNHNLLKVKLPDGSQWAVDFHQNRAGNAPLIRKWDDARNEWRHYLGGDEFMERTSYTLGGDK